ncbi:MAG: hypothetical protein K9M45_10915 [Kiritimatiellales bacterium]|nr:hypothetical protein [Kiritimatiellales bacterium]
MKDKQPPKTLKHRMQIMQAEAASISVAIHVAFILLAGSIVAVRWINKEAAEFAGENIDRPKLERRQLQMPVKVKNMQKKSRRPQVKTRMSTASQTAFELPDMTKGKGMDSAGFGDDYGSAGAGKRDLSGLGAAGSLGFGVSGVNFFGVKSSGEKLMFVIDASNDMLLDSKGGFYTYQYVKDRLFEMVSGMKAATLFNVIVFDGRNKNGWVYMFKPQMVPATEANRDALKAWFDPINKTPASVGALKKQANYKPNREYDSVYAKEPRDWALGATAAMEQTPDNIFILGSGWNRQEISQKRQEEMFHPGKTREQWLKSEGWSMEQAEKADAEYDAQREKAKKMLEVENKARAEKGLPKKFIHNWFTYMKELDWEIPQQAPRPRNHYEYDEVMDHVKAVATFNYKPKDLAPPKIHYVFLVPSNYKVNSGDEAEVERVQNLKKMTATFKGRFEYLRGAKTMENLLNLNPLLIE